MEDFIQSAKNRQIAYLEDTIRKLKAFDKVPAAVQLSFAYSYIGTDKEIETLVAALPKGKEKYIYYFETDNPQAIINDFQNISLENKTIFKFTRFNKHETSNILYVGSSKNLRKRFEQHCGHSRTSKSLYAMKLQNWLSDQEVNQGVRIVFHYFLIDTNDQEVMQHIEDGLWRELKPVFGKCGSKT